MDQKGLWEWLFGEKKPERLKPSEMAGGHRGIAMGSRDNPDRSAENVAKWEQFTGNEVEDFVYGGKLVKVHSSNMAFAKYDHEKEEMIAGFKNGGIYSVTPITPKEAVSFMQASSKGSWWWDRIRIRGTKNGHRKTVRQISS